MKRVYIAGPLFTESERDRNTEIRDLVKSIGFDTFLPHEDGKLSYDDIENKGKNVSEVRKEIFQLDTKEVDQCDIMLAILDGRVPDEGTCIELGMAHAKGKICIGYLTDARTLDPYGVSLMIEGCLTHFVHSKEELSEILPTLK